MPKRNAQDVKLQNKRIRDHVKVLEFLMNTDNLKNSTTGKLESPQKLVVFYAGYIAMRRIWEDKSDHGRMLTGDAEIDQDKKRPESIIYRIDMEVAHPLGYSTSTLFRVTKFKYWGRKFLKICDK